MSKLYKHIDSTEWVDRCKSSLPISPRTISISSIYKMQHRQNVIIATTVDQPRGDYGQSAQTSRTFLGYGKRINIHGDCLWLDHIGKGAVTIMLIEIPDEYFLIWERISGKNGVNYGDILCDTLDGVKQYLDEVIIPKLPYI